MFQYIILTQYEYQEISKNWPGENHFGSAGLPPTLEMRKLKSERLRLFSSLAPNFHLPFVQFLQPSPLNFPVPIWASQFPTPTSPISSGPSPPSNFNFHCPAQASPHLPTALNVGRFGLFCQVFSQGHFHLGARWLTMEDPIERELVVNSIHKYQNTWPESLEAH